MKKVKFFSPEWKKIKKNLLVFGKYQKYFISCVENISYDFSPERKKIKKNLLVFGKYQKYFISCVENISNFTRATHS